MKASKLSLNDFCMVKDLDGREIVCQVTDKDLPNEVMVKQVIMCQEKKSYFLKPNYTIGLELDEEVILLKNT